MLLPAFHQHLSVWLVIGGLELAYLWTIRRHKLRTSAPGASRRQITLFSLGVGLLFLGAQWPMHDLAEGYLYSAHMVQHMLFMYFAPPLLIAGTPVWMLRKMLAPRPVAAVARRLLRPVPAIILFNAVLLLTHWPAIVELSVRSELFHFGAHFLLLASALVMWWPIVSPLPELPALPAPVQLAYLFVQSLAPNVPAAFLTFGSTPLYPVYATFPRIWNVGVMTDQLMAGLIMKLAGTAYLWTLMTVIFFRWHAREERDGLDALQFRNVERDVRVELGRR